MRETQPDALSVTGVVLTALALVAGIAIVALVLWRTADLLAGRPLRKGSPVQLLPRAEDSLWMERAARGERLETGGQDSGAARFPLLQTDPSEDLRRFRAREDSLLQGWGWTDRAAGRIRIPVEAAMRRLAEPGR